MGENGSEQPTPTALSWDICRFEEEKSFLYRSLAYRPPKKKVLATLGALLYSEVVETKLPGPGVLKMGHWIGERFSYGKSYVWVICKGGLESLDTHGYFCM
jgi:hypothetical protein